MRRSRSYFKTCAAVKLSCPKRRRKPEGVPIRHNVRYLPKKTSDPIMRRETRGVFFLGTEVWYLITYDIDSKSARRYDRRDESEGRSSSRYPARRAHGFYQ